MTESITCNLTNHLLRELNQKLEGYTLVREYGSTQLSLVNKTKSTNDRILKASVIKDYCNGNILRVELYHNESINSLGDNEPHIKDIVIDSYYLRYTSRHNKAVSELYDRFKPAYRYGVKAV